MSHIKHVSDDKESVLQAASTEHQQNSEANKRSYKKNDRRPPLFVKCESESGGLSPSFSTARRIRSFGGGDTGTTPRLAKLSACNHLVTEAANELMLVHQQHDRQEIAGEHTRLRAFE
jgi:hypothetical protein